MINSMSFPLAIGEMMSESRELDRPVTIMGEDEFRAFYERTARPLWAYLSRISGDRQKADDFLQEAYYRFLRANRTYESEAHRRNALYQIATNIARDSYRRRSRVEEVELPEEHESPVAASEVPSPERQITIKTDVTRAMQQLEPAQRELLWLAYVQGSSHDEISEILGVRSISVRTLLLRARRKLASILEAGAEARS
jgi:RNA polymerase sigma-70 factor (ECF subfamily)